MTLLGHRRQSLRWLTGNINHVLPFFKNWIFINFLKCTNVRLRESSPIIFEMWWNLLPRVFMPILLLLLLKISNFSCLPVQIMLLRSVTCSEVQFSLISLIVKNEGCLLEVFIMKLVNRTLSIHDSNKCEIL